MKALAAASIVFLLGWGSPATSAVSPAQLDDVRVDAKPDAAIPLALSFVDANGSSRTLSEAIAGTPAVLVFADYMCTNLCGPILTFAAGGLEESGLIPGKDFHLVVVGLDPKEGVQQAGAMASRIGMNAALAAATTFLIGKPDVIAAATQAAGYHYVYDTEHEQFAHPAAAFVLTKTGHIVRVMSGLGLSGGDLRLALVDAGQGHVGSVLDQIRLRCFGFDPAKGIYTASISRWLAIASMTTTMLLGGGIALMVLATRRRAQS